MRLSKSMPNNMVLYQKVVRSIGIVGQSELRSQQKGETKESKDVPFPRPLNPRTPILGFAFSKVDLLFFVIHRWRAGKLCFSFILLGRTKTKDYTREQRPMNDFRALESPNRERKSATP